MYAAMEAGAHRHGHRHGAGVSDRVYRQPMDELGGSGITQDCRGNVFGGRYARQYIALWVPVSLAAIVLDDWLRFWMFSGGEAALLLMEA